MHAIQSSKEASQRSTFQEGLECYHYTNILSRCVFRKYLDTKKCCNKERTMLWHVDPLLGKGCEISSYIIAVVRQWQQLTRTQKQNC
jgi:hypothetical protein